LLLISTHYISAATIAHAIALTDNVLPLDATDAGTAAAGTEAGATEDLTAQAG